MFNKTNIKVIKDANTGKILNHNCDVVMDESIGKSLPFVLSLIWSQNIDNG